MGVVTGSYDSTVKTWSLDRTLRFKYTYQKHKKPVHSVAFLNRGQAIASSDQTLHVWDPQTQQPAIQMTHGSHYKAIKTVDDSLLLAVSTYRNQFFMVDVGAGRVANEWVLPVHAIRGFNLSADNRYVFIGSDSGVISALDLRTGRILNQWKAHDSSILRVETFGDALITSSTDRTVCKWDMNATDPTLSLKLKGYNEPAANFAEMGGSLLTTSASRVAIIPLYQEGGVMQVNPVKLHNSKNDRITAMQALPLHRFFMLGTEDGFLKFARNAHVNEI